MMNIQEVVEFVSTLIAIRSPSEMEHEAIRFLEARFSDRGWTVERIPVSDERNNLLVTFGEPTVVFTTHVDIVAAPDRLFTPTVRDGKLYGRGACDAKGIIGSMFAAVDRLERSGERGFALLIVVGEESNGIGAITAGKSLQGRGIRFIVDGEPTEGKLMAAHKGGLGFRVRYRGRSCHSGYPQLGDDANVKLIRFMHTALALELGEDPILGRATINLGRIKAGTGDNIVSDIAEVSGMVRTVTPNDDVVALLKNAAGPDAEFEILANASLVRLKTIPGIDTDIAAYCTDIPYFLPLQAECLLYGPGTISLAHTDDEHILISDLEKAIEGYIKIFKALQNT